MGCKRDLTGKLAVVTGASSGIGLCFCRELASRGCDLLMISNQQEELERYSADISSVTGVKTYTMYLDLTSGGCGERVLQYLEDRGLEPYILINNAGIFSFRPLTDTAEGKIDCFLKLHVEAVTDLTRCFAVKFKQLGRGRILNMSSMSCWMPMPGIALYAATKAYIRVLSRAVHYEMRDSGVSVTVACPGGIATDLFGLPDGLKKLAVAIGVLDTPERFARKAVNKMLKGKKQYINGLLNRMSIVAVSLLPTSVRMLVKHKMLDRNIVR